jgi:hypothetical protein
MVAVLVIGAVLVTGAVLVADGDSLADVFVVPEVVDRPSPVGDAVDVFGVFDPDGVQLSDNQSVTATKPEARMPRISSGFVSRATRKYGTR